MKKFFLAKLSIVFILLIILIIVFFNREQILNSVKSFVLRAENDYSFEYSILDNSNEENIKVLISVQSMNSIEYIEEPNGNKIYGNGKNKILLDYSVKKDEESKFIVKIANKEIKEEKITITSDYLKDVPVTIEKDDPEQLINVTKGDIYKNYLLTLKIGENDNWHPEKAEDFITYEYLITNNLINEDGSFTIYIKLINNLNNNATVVAKKDLQIQYHIYESESLLKAVEEINFNDGVNILKVNDELYGLEVYNIEGDLHISEDTTFGKERDVSNGGDFVRQYAQNMVIVKVNGNITIDEGVTLSTHANANGYGGPKGMLIYSTGTITNNGTISMTARGAKAEGQEVYLWKNADHSYEYIPATMDSTSVGANMNGGNGLNRLPGSGGAGKPHGSKRRWNCNILFWWTRRC